MKKPDRLCLGTVKLGIPDYGFSSNSPTNWVDPLFFLNQAELMGINRFDTSPRYGKSEEVLGQYILQSGTDPIVSSKIDNLRLGDSDTPEIMVASVKASLGKLYLKWLNICYLHQNELEIISISLLPGLKNKFNNRITVKRYKQTLY